METAPTMAWFSSFRRLPRRFQASRGSSGAALSIDDYGGQISLGHRQFYRELAAALDDLLRLGAKDEPISPSPTKFIRGPRIPGLFADPAKQMPHSRWRTSR